MGRTVQHANTEVTINRPIQEVWDFVTAPYNWAFVLKLQAWRMHGVGGEEDTDSVKRTMKVGEKFFEYAYEKDKFDIVGEWVITKCEAPHTYGFKTLKWYGPKLDTGVDATYTLTKIDENTTKWNRDRDTYNKEGKSEVEFLEGEDRLEEMYQNAVKNYLETGKTGFAQQTPFDLHPKGYLQTLKVTDCLYD